MADEGETAKQTGGDNSAQPGDAWGDPISEERQAELRDLFERQQAWAAQPEATRGDSIFKGVKLSGADVFWLLVGSLPDRVSRDMSELHREDLPELHLEGADLSKAHLEGANFWRARLQRANLSRAHLEGANLWQAHLEGANLWQAQLQGAILSRAHLEGANLWWAYLEGAALDEAHLEGAVLGRVTFSSRTSLRSVTITDTPHWYSALVWHIFHSPVYGPVSLADIHWNDVDLTVVDWSGLRRLGDERSERWWWRSREASEQATRANTQLAKRLRDAGLNDDADRFAYRAQVCQRGVHLLRLRLGRWLFSWLLFVLAGYGYRPLRTLFWYLTVIATFAFTYFLATHGLLTFGLARSEIHPLPWYEALVLSVSSFHGRGFFQPVQSLGDPVAILAAIEAVFGLFIEISFIATFTQRYFGR